MNSYLKFLGRNKAYTAIDVFGLAISMMFVVLIGCYAWQEWHVDKQHSKRDRMYYLGVEMRGEKTMGSHWYLQYLLKDKFPEIESSSALYRNSRWLDYEGRPIETTMYFVDSTFYDIFDFKLEQGDIYTALRNPSNIVVTREYARKVWGDEDPIGKSITFEKDEEPLVVTGVMEPMKNTALMTYDKRPVDMLVNFSMIKYLNPTLVSPKMQNATGSEVILLAKEGHDLTTRKKEYEDAIKESFWILNMPDFEVHLEVYPFKDSYFSGVTSRNLNSGNPKFISLLFGIGLVVLLFAIMNYINLTVALAGKRAKEMATRRLLGESRTRIMWRLIGESTLLCSVSMLIGVALAFLMRPYASRLVDTPIDIIGCTNVTTVGIFVIVLLIMSTTSGIIPALLLSSVKPIEAVKGAFARKSNMIFGKIFIVVQNVVTITMIACAATMYLQVRHLVNAPIGYNPTGVIVIPYTYTGNTAGDGMHFRDELMKLSCVDKVSFSQGEPHSRGNNNTMNYEGRTISFQTFTGDSVFMDLLGISLKRDNQTANVMKFYLNMQAFNELGLDEEANGFPYYDKNQAIDGIVNDFMIGNVLTEQHPLQIVILPDKYFDPWNVLIKVHGDEEEALRQVRGVFEQIYSPHLADSVFDKPYLHQQIEEDFEYEHRLSVILTVFAFITIMIAMLGLMAMSTYYVRQRALDIAVHKVMGGTSMEVLLKLVTTFMKYVLIAAVLSVPIIFYVMNDWLSQFSYRINVYWWIYLVSASIAIFVCFVSVTTQCSRAANTNPVNSLK